MARHTGYKEQSNPHTYWSIVSTWHLTDTQPSRETASTPTSNPTPQTQPRPGAFSKYILYHRALQQAAHHHCTYQVKPNAPQLSERVGSTHLCVLVTAKTNCTDSEAICSTTQHSSHTPGPGSRQCHRTLHPLHPPPTAYGAPCCHDFSSWKSVWNHPAATTAAAAPALLLLPADPAALGLRQKHIYTAPRRQPPASLAVGAAATTVSSAACCC